MQPHDGGGAGTSGNSDVMPMEIDHIKAKNGKSGKGKRTKVNRMAKQKEKAKRKEKINLPLTKAANLEKERCKTRARVKVAKLRKVVLFVVKWATTQRIAGKL